MLHSSCRGKGWGVSEPGSHGEKGLGEKQKGVGRRSDGAPESHYGLVQATWMGSSLHDNQTEPVTKCTVYPKLTMFRN